MRRIVLAVFVLLILISCAENKNNNDDLNSEYPKGNFDVFLRAFKSEGILELWIKSDDQDKFNYFKSYPICKKSGLLGPKRMEGDLQVPEGVYKIDRFNPNSSYHLSLGLNYPNRSDLIRGDKDHPGSDIFIHGKCVTIGCIPLTDIFIEEVFELCKIAKNRGQKSIYVHIFPGKMDSKEFKMIHENSSWKKFWDELLPIYMAFEVKKDIPYVLIDENGKYSVKK